MDCSRQQYMQRNLRWIVVHDRKSEHLDYVRMQQVVKSLNFFAITQIVSIHRDFEMSVILISSDSMATH